MKSEIAQKIINETPQQVREKMRDYGEIVLIELTEEETNAAIFEAKLKKWFHERTNSYWVKKEKIK